MNKENILVSALVALVITVGVVFAFGAADQSNAPVEDQGSKTGGVNFEGETFKEDVTMEKDLTVNGGNFTLTTTNSATSSAQFGCWDTYATSTDTAVRLSATTTPGVAYFTFGTCSSL